MMKLSYTIFYVDDVTKTVAFYERAFGLKNRFIHESHMYAELETGNTTFAFANHELINTLLNGHLLEKKASFSGQISLEPDDIDQAYNHAIQAGAKSLKPPTDMPWGFRTAFLQDLNGFIVELAKPI